MNAEELRRLRADITYAMDLRHTYLDREETRWRILETVVSKPFRAFLDERSNQLQVIERDRLARALRTAMADVAGMKACAPDGDYVRWDVENADPLLHYVNRERVLSIIEGVLSALDSTTGDERG